MSRSRRSGALSLLPTSALPLSSASYGAKLRQRREARRTAAIRHHRKASLPKRTALAAELEAAVARVVEI